MKFLLRLSLLLIVLLAGVFVATPLWLSLVFESQLPAGFQLEKLKSGYPGAAGININALHVKGGLKGADLDIVAADIRFNYRGLKSEIGSVSLDVFLRTGEDRSDGKKTLDDLSFPVTKLTGRMPELSISQLTLGLHQAEDITSGSNTAARAVMLEFRTLDLVPRTNNSFRVTTDIFMEGDSGVDGQADIDVSPGSLQAELRFPAADRSLPWLEVSLEQEDRASETTTQVHAVFDAEAADRPWLNSLLALYTDGNVALVSGKLETRLEFAGKELQAIERLSLNARQFKAQLGGGMLDIDAEVLAKREGEAVAIRLPANTEMRYRDSAGNIEALITTVLPGLERTPQPHSVSRLEVGAASNFIIKPDKDPAVNFKGDIKIDVHSPTSTITLEAPDLDLEVTDFSRPDSIVAKGRIELGWKESLPLTYTFAEEDSEPVTLLADGFDIRAQLSSRDGNLFSSGGGVITNGRIKPLGTSAVMVDISWQELDLLNLSGKFGARTQGFRSELGGEVWTGFDLDLDYTVLNGADINGTGILKFDSGPELPIEFTGSALTERWDIRLPESSIELSQLGSVMNAAHFELPGAIKLTGGYIDIEGDIRNDARANGEITGSMMINGHDLGASMQESHVREASFTLDTSFEGTIAAEGPVSIENLSLAGGIDVSHVRMDLHMENMNTINLRNLYAELFDGQMNLKILRFKESSIEAGTAELSHINLGSLLAFADIDGLDGSGFLDISLPAGSDQTGVYIKNGIFHSSEPGHLAYTKEGVAGSNIGLQALENFQYQNLSGTLDYQSNGDYRIGVRLEGKNPDLYGGHPIVFNLTINGSLPELFEALFISGDFEESILKEIRSR